MQQQPDVSSEVHVVRLQCPLERGGGQKVEEQEDSVPRCPTLDAHPTEQLRMISASVHVVRQVIVLGSLVTTTMEGIISMLREFFALMNMTQTFVMDELESPCPYLPECMWFDHCAATAVLS